jgi:uncharacterized SAM-binding protein YcdF (DUF218 family)
MLYLHKILPQLFLPVCVVGYFLIWGLIQKKRWPVLTALVLLWTLSTPRCSDFLLRTLEEGAVRVNPQEMAGSDYVVILSGMIHSVQGQGGAVTEWSDPDRLFAGVELFQALNSAQGQHPAHLIFTGGAIPWWPQTPLEGQYLKQKAVALGVAPELIWVTKEVSTTEEESRAVKALILEHQKSTSPQRQLRVTLVTSAFHMPRARALFEHEGFVVDSYPVDFKVKLREATLLDWMPDAESLAHSQLAFREWLGQAFYGLGHLKSRLLGH